MLSNTCSQTLARVKAVCYFKNRILGYYEDPLVVSEEEHCVTHAAHYVTAALDIMQKMATDRNVTKNTKTIVLDPESDYSPTQYISPSVC